jgi:hypothetical protein
MAIRAGRNNGPPPGSTERADAGPRARSDDRAEQRSDERSSDRQNDRRNDRQNDRANDRQNDRQNDRSSGLGPLGLRPAQTPNLPSWERRQTPAWEQRQVPSWERPQVPVWEQKNPARVMLDEERDARRLARTPRPNDYRPPVVYLLPPYRYFPGNTVLSYGVSSSTIYVTPPPPAETPAPPPMATVETGFLKLEVEPRQTLQIFIDGFYIGTLADLGDEIELRLGARRIELRAPGYRTLVFDTQIVPDRTIVYRGALEPISNAPAPGTQAPLAPQAPEAPAGGKVIYVIPGCYMGNVSPKDIKLRSGCDIGKLTTISP